VFFCTSEGLETGDMRDLDLVLNDDDGDLDD
jgi:hypothetical protein